MSIIQLLHSLVKFLRIPQETEKDTPTESSIDKLKQIEAQELVDIIKIGLSDSFDDVKKVFFIDTHLLEGN